MKRFGNGTPTPREPAKRTGWIGLDVRSGDRIVRELGAQRIFVDYRPGLRNPRRPAFLHFDGGRYDVF